MLPIKYYKKALSEQSERAFYMIIPSFTLSTSSPYSPQIHPNPITRTQSDQRFHINILFFN